MKFIFSLVLYAFISNTAISQSSVVIMEFVKVLDGRHAEAMFFYSNNWKKYREEALYNQHISSFRIMKAIDSADYDFILITEFRDSAQYNMAEANFRPIIKKLRPAGPIMLNNFQPNSFRRSVRVVRATLLNLKD